MLGPDDKPAIMRGGGMPQLTHLFVSRVLLGNRQTLQEVGLNHNTVEVRQFGCFSSHRQLCKCQLVSSWGNLQPKHLQQIPLYSRGEAKIAVTQMAGMYNMLTLS